MSVSPAVPGPAGGPSPWPFGFYHVARNAGGPVVPVAFEYGRRECRIGPATEPSGDPEIDLQVSRPLYARVTPKHPENFPPIRFRTEVPPGSA